MLRISAVCEQVSGLTKCLREEIALGCHSPFKGPQIYDTVMPNGNRFRLGRLAKSAGIVADGTASGQQFKNSTLLSLKDRVTSAQNAITDEFVPRRDGTDFAIGDGYKYILNSDGNPMQAAQGGYIVRKHPIRETNMFFDVTKKLLSRLA